jgi:hypothetical protein
LLQILLVAALDIKTRDVPTVSSINSLLSQYCIASHFCFANLYVPDLGGRQLFALPRLSHGQRPALFTTTDDDGYRKYWNELVKRERQALSKENPRWHLKMETQPDSETP